MIQHRIGSWSIGHGGPILMSSPEVLPMTYVLRDRPDGQVEIIIQKPILVGLFSERDVAERVCAFLQEEELQDVQADLLDKPAVNVEDLTEELTSLVPDLAPTLKPATASKPVKAALPAVVPDQPLAPALYNAASLKMTDAQKDIALRQLSEGEKLTDVARELGVPFAQLRGWWAAQKRHMQKHIAEAGRIPCTLCNRLFVPSISNPHSCARCSQ